MQSRFHNLLGEKADTKIFVQKAKEYERKIVALGKDKTHSEPESAFFIAQDETYQREILKSLVGIRPVKHVVLVGIGGSSLGTEAIYHALRTPKSPTLTVVDSIEHDSINEVSVLLTSVKQVSDIAVVIISKSGMTTETILNATQIMILLEKRYGVRAYKQLVLIGNDDSPLVRIGREKGIRTCTLPKSIEGRFSVFSAIGVVPLTLLGIDMKSVLSGAREAMTTSHMKMTQQSAVVLASHAQSGCHTVNFFTFNERLRLVGMWYRQLLAESIGRTTTRSGAQFKLQLQPTVTSSVDLHSVAELYLGGYRGVFTRFVYSQKTGTGSLPKKHWLIEQLPSLKGKSIASVKNAITHGVMEAYNDARLPYENIEISEIHAREIGLLMATLMSEIGYLAHMLNINPFIQPSVELYKTHVRKALT